LRHCATSRKVKCSRPDEAIEIFNLLAAALGPGVYSTSYRNEYQKQKNIFLWCRERPVLNADKLTAICEPIV
jgi:hypothetical protein